MSLKELYGAFNKNRNKFVNKCENRQLFVFRTEAKLTSFLVSCFLYYNKKQQHEKPIYTYVWYKCILNATCVKRERERER